MKVKVVKVVKEGRKQVKDGRREGRNEGKDGRREGGRKP